MFCIWITLFLLLFSYCLFVFLLSHSCPKIHEPLYPSFLLSRSCPKIREPLYPLLLLSHSCSIPFVPRHAPSVQLMSCLAETIKSLCHVTILQFVYQNCLALLPYDLRYNLTLTPALHNSDPIPLVKLQTPNSKPWPWTLPFELTFKISGLWQKVGAVHELKPMSSTLRLASCQWSSIPSPEPRTPSHVAAVPPLHNTTLLYSSVLLVPLSSTCMCHMSHSHFPVCAPQSTLLCPVKHEQTLCYWNQASILV